MTIIAFIGVTLLYAVINYPLQEYFAYRFNKKLQGHTEKIEESNRILTDVYERRMQNFSRFADKVHEVYAELYSKMVDTRVKVDILVKQTGEQQEYKQTRTEIFSKANAARAQSRMFLSQNAVYFSFDIEKKASKIDENVASLLSEEQRIIREDRIQHPESKKISIKDVNRKEQREKLECVRKEMDELKTAIQEELSEGFHKEGKKGDSNDSRSGNTVTAQRD